MLDPVLSTNLLVFVVIIWESLWKGVALWKSAKRGDTLWFVAIFVVNFFGLLPIFYLWRTKQLEEVLRDTKKFFLSRFRKPV